MAAIDDRLKRLLELEQSYRSLNHGGGGGTSDGVTDDWKADVERQLGQLHGDVRNLLYGLIGGFLVIAAAGWAAYQALEGKFAPIEDRLTKLEVTVGKIETKVDRLERIEAKLDAVLIERGKDAAAR